MFQNPLWHGQFHWMAHLIFNITFEWTFDRKRIFTHSNLNPNPKAKKFSGKRNGTSFFGQGPDTFLNRTDAFGAD